MKREDKVFASVLVMVLLVTAAIVALAPVPQRQIGKSGQLASFQSNDQMMNFITQSGSSNSQTYYRSIYSFAPEAASSLAVVTSAPTFTTTNVQVQGIDEPDFVKTDGTYMYVVSGKTVSIILAYPPESATTVTYMKFDGDVMGIFLAPQRLVVIQSAQVNNSKYGYYTQQESLMLYNTANVSSPVLMRDVSVVGSYINARLSGGYVYAIFQQPTQTYENGTAVVASPTVFDGKTVDAIDASSVFYSTSSGVPFSMYTILLSLKVTDGSHTQTAILTGWGSTIYASNSNVYLAFPDRQIYALGLGVAVGGIRAVPGAPSLLPFWWGGWGTNTTIFRVAYSNGSTQVAAEGTVPGTILNQFSLDEFNGYLRVATTTNAMLVNQTWAQVNNVYVLDQGMKVVGSLEGLGVNERIYSARFMGDIGYMVTFERIDPLFAISFANPTHPVVLSSLELTGFSDYLHPIGNGYLIGVGKNTIPAPAEAGYVLYQGMKASLFHVASDGSSREVSKVLIGDRGSDSPVSTDHRAFVYDQATGLMALPILVTSLDNSSSGGQIPNFNYGTPVFQGAYVFNVSESDGFHLVARITQVPNGLSVQDAFDYYIYRVVLAGGYVYTVSDRAVVVTNLSTLGTVATVKLPYSG